MKRFTYRFEGLENVRGLELDNLRMDLGNSQRSLEEAEDELLRLKSELESSYDEIARLRATRAGQVLQESLSGYGAVLRRRLQEQAGIVQKRRHELEQLRSRVSEKHRETKVLEKHRERKYDQHQQEMQRLSQQELDESAGNISGRQV